MIRSTSAILSMAAALVCTPVRADIPTIDAAQLDQHANTANMKVKLVPVVTNHATARQGVHCATTTGQKGTVSNTAAPANAAVGQNAVQSSAPGTPTSVTTGATGATLSVQDQGRQTAAVAAGAAGSQQTVTNGSSVLSQQSSAVGTSQTVMAAWDANSIARTQQATTFNNVIAAVTALTQAYHVANLARVEIASQSGSSLSYPTLSPTTGATASQCPTGATGAGTSSSPCAAKTSNCTAASATCLVQRTVDSFGNVLFYLASVQSLDQALSTPIATTP